MSRSGQLPADYGEHWSPPTPWSLFGPCGCGAERGRPCLNRRVRHVPPRELWLPHDGRQCFLVPAPERAEELRWRDIGVRDEERRMILQGGWQPNPGAGGSLDDLPLNEWVGQALGAASTCWGDLGRAGVFDSTGCAAIFDALMAHINTVIDGVIAGTAKAVEAAPPGRSLLGETTTRAMLLELEARGATGVLDDQLAPHARALRLLEVAARELRCQLPPLLLDDRTVGK